MKYIRNFSIIAHIDHGKSTLADRFIELSKKKKYKANQILDSMDLEKEKGITIKSQCVTLPYTYNNENYIFNIIDTPGHADFSYEVSRALSSCEGAILLIDASQGIEAQTLSNYNKAIKENIKVIPVLNKIDLIQARPEDIKNDLNNILKIDSNEIIEISAKEGTGINNLIKNIIDKIPAPKNNDKNPFKALIIDSWYNNFLGIISLIRVMDGTLSKDNIISIYSTNKSYKINKLGVFTPEKIYKNELKTGEIGFIEMDSKSTNIFSIGDTISLTSNPTKTPLPGFKKTTSKVFAGIFPEDPKDFKHLTLALSKLILNDSSLVYSGQKSNIFGFGFKCGFLGLLHMEIIQERLKREYNLEIITTFPNVIFKLIKHNNEVIYIDTPTMFNENERTTKILEPIAKINIITYKEYLGQVITLCIKNRGIQTNIIYTSNQVSIDYEIPMVELLSDFFEQLQTVTSGFSSLDYYFYKFKEANLTKLNILINKKKVDALEFILHKDKAYNKSKAIIETIKKLIPKHMFEISIQAAIGKKIISKTTIKALRKNVTEKCYGGDISRKKKLLKKQAKGKKRMKNIGTVQIPQETFLTIFRKGR